MLADSFQTLVYNIEEATSLLQRLHIMIMQDKPDDNVALTDRLGEVCDDALGWAEEAHAQARKAYQSASHPADTTATIYALMRTHRALHALDVHLFSELLTFERSEQLLTLAREREKPWRLWVVALRQGLERLQNILLELHQDLLTSWQDVAEHSFPQRAPKTTAKAGQTISLKNSKQIA